MKGNLKIKQPWEGKLMKMQKNIFSCKNILITGITGFVGKKLACRLIDAGARVHGLMRDFVPAGMNSAWTLVHGNIEDVRLVKRIINEYAIHLCFHLAAQSIVSLGNLNPVEVFETNVKGAWSVFEACRSGCNPTGVVFASSDKAYGNQDMLPCRESYVLNGENVYDASKVCGEYIARAFHKAFGLPIGITRCANIYGPGDLNFSRIIPETVKNILLDEPVFIRSNGKFQRDYMYIDDAVNAYMKMGEGILTGNIIFDAFNFGTGKPVAVEELVKRILQLAGSRQSYFILDNSGRHEIPNQFLDIEKAETMLGWAPGITLEEGLEKTIDWYRDYFEKKL